MNVEALLPMLPLIGGWIDETLRAHASQSRPVTDFGFTRLRDFYSDDLLARTKVVIVPKVPTPPLSALGLHQFGAFENGNYAGITFKDTYFVQISQARVESLHFHELVHIVQWAHLGAEHFLLAYAAGLMEKGYRDSPLEAMAYELQGSFERGDLRGNVEIVIRDRLDVEF